MYSCTSGPGRVVGTGLGLRGGKGWEWYGFEKRSGGRRTDDTDDND